MKSATTNDLQQPPYALTSGAYRLHSAFQPIFSLSHRRAVGFEGLLRPVDADGQAVTPTDYFRHARQTRPIAELDRECRELHIRNFSAAGLDGRWLFLNLEPAIITDRVFDDGRLLSALEAAGLSPDLLVVEILESAISDEGVLRDAVAYFRSIGATLALDDFGAGHSNFDRIWRLAPDIIKLDRSLIVEAEQHRTDRLQRMLPNLVSLMHEAGSLVLAEGIETEDQALVAMDADLDFAQGFYFAKPQSLVSADIRESEDTLERLTRSFVTSTIVDERTERLHNEPYIETFREATVQIENGTSIEQAIQLLLNMPRTARYYLLNTWGEQIALHYGLRHPDNHASQPAPISGTTGGSWYRRQYFRAAMSEPNRLQVSRPYLSTADAHMCITLSVACGSPPRYVLCCDISS